MKFTKAVQAMMCGARMHTPAFPSQLGYMFWKEGWRQLSPAQDGNYYIHTEPGKPTTMDLLGQGGDHRVNNISVNYAANENWKEVVNFDVVGGIFDGMTNLERDAMRVLLNNDISEGAFREQCEMPDIVRSPEIYKIYNKKTYKYEPGDEYVVTQDGLVAKECEGYGWSTEDVEQNDFRIEIIKTIGLSYPLFKEGSM